MTPHNYGFTLRDIFVARLHQAHGPPSHLFGAQGNQQKTQGGGAEGSSGQASGDVAQMLSSSQGASVAQLRSPEVQREILKLEAQKQISPASLKRIRQNLLVPSVSDSEDGIKQALRTIPEGGIREKIRILSAVYDFLQKVGRSKAVEIRNGKLKVDPLLLAANAVWKSAVTAVPALRIVKSVAERVIKIALRQMKIWYNNRCGGVAKDAIGDFASVGRSSKMDNKCGRAQDEPDWVSRGFSPYVWRTGVSTSRWSYSPAGFSKTKKEIKDLKDARRRRRGKAPPKFKRGGKNEECSLAPLPGAAPI